MSFNGTNRNGARRVVTLTQEQLFYLLEIAHLEYQKEFVASIEKLKADIKRLEDQVGTENETPSKYAAKSHGGAWHPLTASSSLRDVPIRFRPSVKMKHRRYRAALGRAVIELECSQAFRDAIASQDDDKNNEMNTDPKVRRLFHALADLGMTLFF